jgi:hypothetical protein
MQLSEDGVILPRFLTPRRPLPVRLLQESRSFSGFLTGTTRDACVCLEKDLAYKVLTESLP